MRTSRTLAALCAFFVVAIGVAGCGSGVPGNSVAVVAGNPITTQAFNHWMYIAAKGNATQSPGAPVIVPNDPPQFAGCIKQARAQIPTLAKTPTKQLRQECATLFQSLSSQVMDFLIKAYWYQAQAYKLGIHLTDAQVQKNLAQAKKQQFPTATAFNTFLTQTGQTMRDITFRIRVNTIYKDLLARYTPKITQARIAAYYASHKSQFGTPASRDIRLVRTNSRSQAQAALSALKSGQSWQVVAKKYSVDQQTKNNGGLLRGVNQTTQEQTLSNTAFATPLHKLAGPVHGTFGWYVIEVIKVNPGSTPPLSKEAPLIKQLLTSQLQATAQATVDKQAKKRWGSQTQCRAAYAMSDCKGYKAPTTTTTPSPQTSPGTSTGTPTPTPTTTTSSSGGTKKKTK